MESAEVGDPGADELEAGRKLFARPATFMLSVAKLDQLPPAGLPEVAFAGRSNVGKSSLINTLTGRSSLARTSNTPGRTQQINLFDLSGRLILADLPGYGYAQAPKDLVERWTRLVFAYLRGRPSLMRVCLLIDFASRHQEGGRGGARAAGQGCRADSDRAHQVRSGAQERPAGAAARAGD